MLLTAYVLDINHDFVAMHPSDAADLGIKWREKVEVTDPNGNNPRFLSLFIYDPREERGYLGIGEKVAKSMNISTGDKVNVNPRKRPKSIDAILKKMNGGKLNAEETESIIHDMTHGILTDREIAPYVTAVYINKMDMDEIESLTRSMVNSGEQLTFKRKPVVDKHSIGGVPGNKISLLVVPIIGAANQLIPKTCSRAITGAGGTADLMEALAPVSFTAREIETMVNKAGAVIVWGGATNIAPADDIIIQYEYPFKIDARGQMLASIMSKKKAVGSEICVIDLPTGPGTKVPTIEDGKILAGQLIDLGKRLGMKVECAITDGSAPIGRDIGVNLEVAEALRILEQKDGVGPLIEKSCSIAGIALEMAGVASAGSGYDAAMSLIRNGKAWKKMQDIIEIQGGDSKIKAADLPAGDFKYEVPAPTDGYISSITNRPIIDIARAAGSPFDHGAGIHINKMVGERVMKGDVLYTIYAEKEWKLSEAIKIAEETQPLKLGGMLVKRIQ